MWMAHPLGRPDDAQMTRLRHGQQEIRHGYEVGGPNLRLITAVSRSSSSPQTTMMAEPRPAYGTDAQIPQRDLAGAKSRNEISAI